MDDLTIQRIKDAADIVDVVGSYVELHRKGQNWLGLCPFHNDKHLGSFVVSRNKKSYRCFSCDAHGDAIDFVMKMENFLAEELKEQVIQPNYKNYCLSFSLNNGFIKTQEYN